MEPPVIYAASENSITLSFGNILDESINDKVYGYYQIMITQRKPHWTDIIPAYASVTIVYDLQELKSIDIMKQEVEKLLKEQIPKSPTGRLVRIPVCYDSSFGPDLIALAKKKKLSTEKIIELHAHKPYRVYMLGFLPGFPYMGIVNEQIAIPRLKTPRLNVAAGSVGIAGRQTGIYPVDSPGGWNIIGRTPVTLFNVTGSPPVLLQPGDNVTFYPITREEFDAFDVSSFKPL